MNGYNFDSVFTTEWHFQGLLDLQQPQVKSSFVSRRQRAIEAAADRVAETVAWLSIHKFSTDAQLKRWQSMVPPPLFSCPPLHTYTCITARKHACKS